MVRVLLTTWDDTGGPVPVWAYHKKHSRLPESIVPKTHVIIGGLRSIGHRLLSAGSFKKGQSDWTMQKWAASLSINLIQVSLRG